MKAPEFYKHSAPLEPEERALASYKHSAPLEPEERALASYKHSAPLEPGRETKASGLSKHSVQNEGEWRRIAP